MRDCGPTFESGATKRGLYSHRTAAPKEGIPTTSARLAGPDLVAPLDLEARDEESGYAGKQAGFLDRTTYICAVLHKTHPLHLPNVSA